MLRKLAAVISVLLLLGVSAAAAQDNRTVFWQRWDVKIDNVDTTNNQFDVDRNLRRAVQRARSLMARA